MSKKAFVTKMKCRNGNASYAINICLRWLCIAGILSIECLEDTEHCTSASNPGVRVSKSCRCLAVIWVRCEFPCKLLCWQYPSICMARGLWHGDSHVIIIWVPTVAKLPAQVSEGCHMIMEYIYHAGHRKWHLLHYAGQIAPSVLGMTVWCWSQMHYLQQEYLGQSSRKKVGS